jgi:hypothetical protein
MDLPLPPDPPATGGNAKEKIAMKADVRSQAWRRCFALLAAALLTTVGCGDDNGTTGTDTTPPDAVSDLAVSAVYPTEATLTWIAPGDDATSGTAHAYDIRYSPEPFDETSWDSVTQAEGEPEPQPGGTPEQFTLTDLTPESIYHFALKTADEAWNWSPISNVVSDTTTRQPRAWMVNPEGTGDAPTIQAAVDSAAAEGDTVVVAAGTYDETLLIEGKSIVLIGAGPDETIVQYDSNPGEEVLRIRDCDSLQISGFRFSQIYIWCLNGILIESAGVAISDCAVINCGLTAAWTDLLLSQCTVYGNPPSDCDAVTPLVHLIEGTARLERNIVAASIDYGVACSDVEVTFTCNDCYEHNAGNYGGCTDPTGTDGNISENPLFVDAAHGNFHLREDSPCLEGVSECGRMGAFGMEE